MFKVVNHKKSVFISFILFTVLILYIQIYAFHSHSNDINETCIHEAGDFVKSLADDARNMAVANLNDDLMELIDNNISKYVGLRIMTKENWHAMSSEQQILHRNLLIRWLVKNIKIFYGNTASFGFYVLNSQRDRTHGGCRVRTELKKDNENIDYITWLLRVTNGRFNIDDVSFKGGFVIELRRNSAISYINHHVREGMSRREAITIYLDKFRKLIEY